MPPLPYGVVNWTRNHYASQRQDPRRAYLDSVSVICNASSTSSNATPRPRATQPSAQSPNSRCIPLLPSPDDALIPSPLPSAQNTLLHRHPHWDKPAQIAQTISMLNEDTVLSGLRWRIEQILDNGLPYGLLVPEMVEAARADMNICGTALDILLSATSADGDPPVCELPLIETNVSGAQYARHTVPLTSASCPQSLRALFTKWDSLVSRLKQLEERYHPEIARIICEMEPLENLLLPKVTQIATDLRSMADEISLRRAFLSKFRECLLQALRESDGFTIPRFPTNLDSVDKDSEPPSSSNSPQSTTRAQSLGVSKDVSLFDSGPTGNGRELRAIEIDHSIRLKFNGSHPSPPHGHPYSRTEYDGSDKHQYTLLHPLKIPAFSDNETDKIPSNLHPFSRLAQSDRPTLSSPTQFTPESPSIADRLVTQPFIRDDKQPSLFYGARPLPKLRIALGTNVGSSRRESRPFHPPNLPPSAPPAQTVGPSQATSREGSMPFHVGTEPLDSGFFVPDQGGVVPTQQHPHSQATPQHGLNTTSRYYEAAPSISRDDTDHHLGTARDDIHGTRPSSIPSISVSDWLPPDMVAIREAMYGAIADAFSTPAMRQVMAKNKHRAYFSAVCLAIFNVSTTLQPAGSKSLAIVKVMGRNIRLLDLPGAYRTVMTELASIGREAKRLREEDDERAIAYAVRGKDLPESRMGRVKRLLERGVGYVGADGRVRGGSSSASNGGTGRSREFSNRINALCLEMKKLPLFQEDMLRMLAPLDEKEGRSDGENNESGAMNDQKIAAENEEDAKEVVALQVELIPTKEVPQLKARTPPFSPPNGVLEVFPPPLTSSASKSSAGIPTTIDDGAASTLRDEEKGDPSEMQENRSEPQSTAAELGDEYSDGPSIRPVGSASHPLVDHLG